MRVLRGDQRVASVATEARKRERSIRRRPALTPSLSGTGEGVRRRCHRQLRSTFVLDKIPKLCCCAPTRLHRGSRRDHRLGGAGGAVLRRMGMVPRRLGRTRSATPAPRPLRAGRSAGAKARREQARIADPRTLSHRPRAGLPGRQKPCGTPGRRAAPAHLPLPTRRSGVPALARGCRQALRKGGDEDLLTEDLDPSRGRPASDHNPRAKGRERRGSTGPAHCAAR